MNDAISRRPGPTRVSAPASAGGTGLAFVLLFVLASLADVRTDDPVSSNVRYTGEIVRVLERRCVPCHGSNSLAMPLTSYREVRDWGRAIREEIVEQRMPPWSAAPGYARIQNELALTARETTTILSWLDGGMPRGDDRELPRVPRADPERAPDLRLAVPAQHVPAGEEHVVRRVTIDTGLAADVRAARVGVVPGNGRVLRGALVFLDDGGTAGQWVGGWLPWQRRIAPDSPHTFRLPAGARLRVELQYRGAGHAVNDIPSVEVYFADASAAGRDERRPTRASGARSSITELRAGSASPARLPAAATLWALVPFGDERTTSLEITARRPNGAIEVLLWMPEYRHDWPHAFALQQPLALPAGTLVTVAAEPDTAAAGARLSLLP